MGAQLDTERYTFPVEFRSEHLGDGLKLSVEASWNQTITDWRTFLDVGRIYATIQKDGTLVGTVGLLPMGERLYWISLVLVSVKHRGRGIATDMVTWAIDFAAELGGSCMLDATAAGSTIYRKLGFSGGESLFRCLVSLTGNEHLMKDYDKPEKISLDQVREIAHWDFCRTGLDREALFRYWVSQDYASGFVSRGGEGDIEGYSFFRPGYGHPQIGPLVAEKDDILRQHLHAHGSSYQGKVYMDLTASGLRRLRSQEEFPLELEREFLRMGLPDAAYKPSPGQIAISGPEFG